MSDSPISPAPAPELYGGDVVEAPERQVGLNNKVVAQESPVGMHDQRWDTGKEVVFGSQALGEEEEAQQAAGIRDPGAPTLREIAEHELTHLPHRSWCHACVAGRSRDRPHKRLDGRDPSAIPCVVFDYGFFGGLGDEEAQAVQIARDVGTGMLFAHIVPRKGLVADHGVAQMLKDIERLGHKKMCLKCDGEASLVAIQHEVKRVRADDTLLENSPAGDSRSNGIAERAVQSISEQVRVVRNSLETHIQAKIPGTHPVTCWLVEHCADLLNKYQKGQDGRTAYQRLRGKPWLHEMVAFGEKVHYKINLKEWDKRYKLEARWGEGYFLGVKWRTGESWIGTKGGILKASAIRRVGAHRRWDAEGLMAIKGVPWDHVQADAPPGQAQVRFIDPALLPKPEVAEDEGPRRRRARLNKQDFVNHGFTQGCLGCRALIQGGDTRPHTETCRARMEDKLKTTPEGQARLGKAKERLDVEVAARMERMMEEAETRAKRARPNEPDEASVAPNMQAGSSNPQATDNSEGVVGTGASSSCSGAAPSSERPKRPQEESAHASRKKSKGEPKRGHLDPSGEELSPKRTRGELDEREQDMETSVAEIGIMERLMQEDFEWSVCNVSDMCDAEPLDVQRAVTDMTYYDETTGEAFDPRLVRLAEEEELSRFAKMSVYKYADRATAMSDPEGIFVKVRWVRVNKGTKDKPQMKCRLVAQELAYGTRMDEMFANTPSLSCVKLAMLYAAEERKMRKLMVLDVKSAFLYGAARRKIFIELPTADPKSGGNTVGELVKALYGTRDAPQIWQHEVRKTLKAMGFRQSTSQPSVYFHDKREVFLMVHVDDFLVAGTHQSLEWVYTEMSKVYELKRAIISSCPSDAHAASYLNRKLTWDTYNNMSYEGDPKHTDMLLKEWGLVQCKSVSSTLTKELADNVGEGPKLNESEGRRVRRSIARVNFMSQDRPDLCCAARILSKHMSAPTEGTRLALQHVVKYLKGHRRCVNQVFASIPSDSYVLSAFCDSDWANDKVDRKSCSGGVMCLAGMPIAFWSKSQSNIALSSGEAELNSSVKTLSEMLGVIGVWEEVFGRVLPSTLHTDSSACKGMLLRAGAGKVKHLSTKQLWVQAVVEATPITIMKIPRRDNCADMLTHCLPEGEAASQLRRMNFTCMT